MDKRQAELEKLMLEYEKQCLNDLQKTYTEALADVKRRLRGLLGSEQTQSIVYQVNFQETLQKQLEAALNSLKSGSITSVSEFLNKTYEDSYLGTIYGIQGQGIPINIGIDHEQLARTINRRTDTMQFSQRLYDNVDKLGIAFKSQMSRGIANNSTYSKIAKQLAMESEANYRQAMRIVRTEGGRVKSEAKLDSMKKAKDAGADIVKQWDATFDGKTRAEHRYLDGQIKEIGEPFVDSQGREAQAPHKFGIASMDINCRCIVVERARWAVEGEEMPNKVDSAGELVEAKNYKEWKQKYQSRQAAKEVPNNAKVFDKNSKELPSKNDYFKLPNNELVKIVEVNDYQGIKSVTLENGQTIVLSNLKAPTKLTTNNFPMGFTDSTRTKSQTKKLVEYVNGIEGNDGNAKDILANLDKLETYGDENVGFKIVYGEKGAALRTWTKYSGEAVRAELRIPKLEENTLVGAANTQLHEIGHLVDSYAGTKSKVFGMTSRSNARLTEIVSKGVGDPSDEIMDIFKQANNDVKEIQEMIGNPLADINRIYREGGFASYSEYVKAYRRTKKEVDAKRNYMPRNKLNGINNLQDIYDALSGGEWQNKGIIKYGHGKAYFAQKGNKESEIFANYFSLSILRPDLVDVLRRDKPELVAALDDILEDILKGIK